jgi:hypothetical protein
MKKLNTGIFIFDGVEVLDFAGPFEVFSRTRLVPASNRDDPMCRRHSTCTRRHDRRIRCMRQVVARIAAL